MAASRNGREDLELNASQDGGCVLTPARLETHRGRLKMWGSSWDALGCLEMGGSDLMSVIFAKITLNFFSGAEITQIS
jgi:hypothetical protein